MRTLALLVLLLGACDSKKTTSDGGDGDSGVPTDGGGDLAGGVTADMTCMPTAFFGFPGDNSVFHSHDCNCGGCLIDAFENNTVNTNWGRPTIGDATLVPMQGVGLGVMLSTSGMLSVGSLISEGPTAQFYLDGDFDILVDYDLGATAPPGASVLVFGVQKPQAVNGTPLYRVERQHATDGSEKYHSNLGGIDKDGSTTPPTHGTLRLTRVGYVVTAYADDQMVQTLIAQNAERLVVTLAATLTTCSGTSPCGYTPFWHRMRMQSGLLVNQP